MRRYIRTKDGKIIDLGEYLNLANTILLTTASKKFPALQYCHYGVYEGYNFEIDIQADAIEELIEVGDLISTSFETTEKVTSIEPNENCSLGGDETIIFVNNMGYVDREDITELYTKQGNNYILVARKENGKWRVI